MAGLKDHLNRWFISIYFLLGLLFLLTFNLMGRILDALSISISESALYIDGGAGAFIVSFYLVHSKFSNFQTSLFAAFTALVGYSVGHQLIVTTGFASWPVTALAALVIGGTTLWLHENRTV